jgi:hypothetical protein
VDGNVLFKGPVNSPFDVERLPPDVAELYRDIESHFTLVDPGAATQTPMD